MTPFRRLPTSPRILSLGLLSALVLASGCGGDIDVDQANERGAVLFNERCSGCHTLEAANSYGSKEKDKLQGGERTNGPNFDQRKETRDDVLFAIRNGGFSGAIMPANIAVGSDAAAIADFLTKYSGKDAQKGD